MISEAPAASRSSPSSFTRSKSASGDHCGGLAGIRRLQKAALSLDAATAAIEEMLSDYSVMRDQARACE
jgi:hypothetical protein